MACVTQSTAPIPSRRAYYNTGGALIIRERATSATLRRLTRSERNPPPRSGPVVPVERVREEPPAEGAWRGDPLAGSRHSRLIDELQLPAENRDPENAAAICAEASRLALGDLSPALILLPLSERRRVQALSAYTLTLYDFVRQTGLEGERLTQVNRWEFELDSALEGRPTGQPVFVAIAAQHRTRPWSSDGFDRLHLCARRRIMVPRPATPEAVQAESSELASALITALLGPQPPDVTVELVAAWLRLEGLRNLGDGLRRHRPTLAVSELPDTWETAPAAPGPPVSEPVAREAERLREILESASGSPATLPPPYRRCTRFLRSAGLRILSEIEKEGMGILETPPRLGLAERVGLLMAARILG